MQITTVTTKGQVTLPAEIRKKVGIRPGSRVVSEYLNGEIRVRLIPDFFSLRGSVKRPSKYKKLSLQEMIKIEKRAAESGAVKEYLVKALKTAK